MASDEEALHDYTLPTSFLREFYDPTGEYSGDDDEALFNFVAGLRVPVTIGNLALAGNEVIVAEAFHAGIPLPEAVEGRLTVERLEEIHDTLGLHAGWVVDRVIETSNQVYTELQNKIGITYPDLCEEFIPVIRAKVLATDAHYGIFRRNRNRYMSHPEAVGSIWDIAYQTVYHNDPEAKTGDPTDFKRQFGIIIGNTHDAYEDTVDPWGEYLSRPILPTPYVFEKLLDQKDYPFPHAALVGKTLRLMAHTKGIGNKKMPYPNYIARGVMLGGVEFAQGKDPDLQHNGKIDPDVHDGSNRQRAAKVNAKNRRYDNAREQISHVKLSDNQSEATLQAAMFDAIHEVTSRQVKRHMLVPVPYTTQIKYGKLFGEVS